MWSRKYVQLFPLHLPLLSAADLHPPYDDIQMAKVLFPIESPMASMPKLPFLTKDGNPTFIPTNKLLDPKIKHAFLIRDPNDAFPSLIKPLLHKRSEGFFNKEELGVTHIRQLYDFISEKTDNKPLVIDSDDLVDNTEAALRALCEYADLPFDTNMLSWESGASDARTLFECFEGGAGVSFIQFQHAYVQNLA